MTITTDSALIIVTKALEAGLAQNCPIVAVVTDISGNIVAAARMEGVSHINTEIARKKALASAAFRMTTADLAETVTRDPLAKAVVLADQSINVLPGGVPIRDGDVVIGALGVAGGYYMQDRAIADFATS